MFIRKKIDLGLNNLQSLVCNKNEKNKETITYLGNA